MLKKKERLKREEFNRFFSNGKRFHAPGLQLIYSPHETFHGSVVVSKKVFKSAVKRNKLRRRIYDILRFYNKTHTQGGVFIVVVKNEAASLPHLKIRDGLMDIIGRIENKG